MNRFDIAKIQGTPDTYAPPVNGEIPRDLEGKPLVLERPIYYCAVIEGKSGHIEQRAYVYQEVRLIRRGDRIYAALYDARDDRDPGHILSHDVKGTEVCTTKDNCDTLVRNLCNQEKQKITNKIRAMLKELSFLVEDELRYDQMSEAWTIIDPPVSRDHDKPDDLPF